MEFRCSLLMQQLPLGCSSSTTAAVQTCDRGGLLVMRCVHKQLPASRADVDIAQSIVIHCGSYDCL